MKPNIIKLILFASAISVTKLAGAAERLSEKDEAIFKFIFSHNLGSTEWFKDLKQAISDGANINVQHPIRKDTPLHLFVVRYSHDTSEIVKFLLECGAEVNTIDEDGNTPLHEVGISVNSVYSAAITRLLMEYGANPHLKNNSEKSALDLAKEQVNPNLETNKKLGAIVLMETLYPKRINTISDSLNQTDLPTELHDIILGYTGLTDQELKELRNEKHEYFI